MNLTAEKLQENYDKLISYIHNHIASPRKEQLIDLYNTHAERIMMMPASGTEHFHNAWIGGYVDHVIRVIECSIDQHNIWEKHGVDTSTYTFEELMGRPKDALIKTSGTMACYLITKA